MNSVHDMGGMHGMGPIDPEPDEPVFHEEWEKRVLAMNLAGAFLRRWNLDIGRHTREQMPPADYLRSSYYEKWLWGLERMLVERGVLAAAPGELKPLTVDDVPKVVWNRVGARMDGSLKTPRFKQGDRVKTLNFHPTRHTRLPRYARGKLGVVERDHGVFIFPDEHAMTGTKLPSRCYAVRFEGRELWGRDTGPRDAIYVDLFDEYLEPA
jgi:nitrile hydratase